MYIRLLSRRYKCPVRLRPSPREIYPSLFRRSFCTSLSSGVPNFFFGARVIGRDLIMPSSRLVSPQTARVSRREEEERSGSDSDTENPPSPTPPKRAKPTRKPGDVTDTGTQPPVNDGIGQYMVPYDEPVGRASTCIVLWLNPFEIILTVVMGVLVYAMLLVYPDSPTRAPSAFWFLTISIVMHLIIATHKSFKDRWILYNLIVIVLDVLMIVMMSIPDTWVRGSDSTSSAIQTDSIVVLVFYVVLFICSFIRLILSLDHTCCFRCCNPPPRPRHRGV